MEPHPGSSGGHLDSVRMSGLGATLPGPFRLEPGRLAVGLVVAGVPVEELPAGARLRIGEAAILALGVAGSDARAVDPAGGVLEIGESRVRPAEVLEGGLVNSGDAVFVDAVVVPLTDVLDLHSFRPEDVTAVVSEYLEEARRAGFAEVRIVHGRGRGVQRAVVRRLLAGASGVIGFADAMPTQGGWGATLVHIRRPGDAASG